MNALTESGSEICDHKSNPEKTKLALITVGNPLRADDGAAAAVCAKLPQSVLSSVCLIDIGIHTNLLEKCLSEHEAAVIVDATQSGTPPGTVCILNLTKLLDRTAPFELNSCHGLSLADELRLAKRTAKLPKHLMFFGIEACGADWRQGLTPMMQQRLPQVRQTLANLLLEMQKW